MNKKGKIESIDDYISSTKDQGEPDPLFYEPFTCLPVDGLTLAWFAIGIIVAAVIGMVILVHYT